MPLRPVTPCYLVSLALLAAWLLPAHASAQAPQVVHLQDGDPYELPCDGGPTYLAIEQFGLERDLTDGPLSVSIQTGGTAIEGVDYEGSPTVVQFEDGWFLGAFNESFRLLPEATAGRTITTEILPGSGYTIGEPAIGTAVIEELPCPTTTTTSPPDDIGFVGDAPSSDTEVLARTGSSTREAWLASLGALLLAGGCVLVTLGRKREAAR